MTILPEMHVWMHWKPLGSGPVYEITRRHRQPASRISGTHPRGLLRARRRPGQRQLAEIILAQTLEISMLYFFVTFVMFLEVV